MSTISTGATGVTRRGVKLSEYLQALVPQLQNRINEELDALDYDCERLFLVSIALQEAKMENEQLRKEICALHESSKQKRHLQTEIRRLHQEIEETKRDLEEARIETRQAQRIIGRASTVRPPHKHKKSVETPRQMWRRLGQGCVEVRVPGQGICRRAGGLPIGPCVVSFVSRHTGSARNRMDAKWMCCGSQCKFQCPKGHTAHADPRDLPIVRVLKGGAGTAA